MLWHNHLQKDMVAAVLSCTDWCPLSSVKVQVWLLFPELHQRERAENAVSEVLSVCPGSDKVREKLVTICIALAARELQGQK